ncbi:MAG: sulfopyruvate decarboxylase subunit alpha, partial [Promethearchaeota archaeon]
ISEEIIKSMKNADVNFFATYPCEKIQNLYSLTHKNFKSVQVTKEEEGVGICAGAALAGAKPAMLIQSTGLGNMINALCSLTLTYQLPLLVLASWRGVYQEKIPAQEPLGQHLPNILQAIGIKHHIVKHREDLLMITRASRDVYTKNEAHVVLLSPQLWEGEAITDEWIQTREIPSWEKQEAKLQAFKERKLTRYEAIMTAAPFLEDRLVISNIGFPSRELYHVKHKTSNFFMLGSLGLASPIGLGVAMFTSKQVVIIDGDGSLLSNLGALATIAQESQENMTILAVDNGVYGSTGNQNTATSACVDLALTAKGLGFKNVFRVSTKQEITSLLSTLSGGPNFVHILALPGNAEVPPIPLSPSKIKNEFMNAVTKA